MKKKSNATFWIIALIAFVLFNIDWFESKPVTNTNVSSSDRSSARSGDTPYSQRATENSWPAIAEEGTAIASNLLASNYYIVLDGSGSMAERECSGGQTKLEAAKTALAAFSQSIPGDANIGLYIFDNNGKRERVELGPNNQARFSDAVFRASANHGTPLKSAIRSAYIALETQAKNQLGYGEYHLVVVTDGQASSGSENPSEFVNLILEKSPVVIHTIGFCIDDRHSLNQPGRTYYRQANNPQSLQQGLTEVLAEAPDFDVDSFSAN